MSDVFGKLVAITVFATCAAAASAQQVSVETGSVDEVAAQSAPVQPVLQVQHVPQAQSVRYSAGESIVLGASARAVPDPVPAAGPQPASVRYSAGDSIVLATPQAPANRRPAAAVQAANAGQPQRFLGYSQAAAIPLAGAFGDSLSTHIGINHASLAEKNGLINTSVVGLAGLFVIKAGIIYYFDHQPKKIREAGLKATAGVWSGVTMNNVLLIAGATNPVSLIGGALFGAYMYHREGQVLANEARRTSAAPASAAPASAAPASAEVALAP